MKKIMLMLVLGIFLITLVSSENICLSDNNCLGIFPRNSNISLWQNCENCTFVNLTSVQLPNSTIINIDDLMSKTGFNYNYSFNKTDLLGKYYYNVVGDKDGDNSVETLHFFITETGQTILEGSSGLLITAVILFFILGTLLFLGFMKSDKKVVIKSTYLIGSFIFFLAGLNTISAVIPDSLINSSVVGFFDSFTAISFIMLWFAFGLLIIMWAISFFQTFLYNKNMKNFQKFGGDYGK